MTQTYRVEVDHDGNVFWHNESGQLHREGGLPACEFSNGAKLWFVNGQPHRDDGLPAKEYASGTKIYYVNGERHREGGLPACEWSDGSKYWYVNGVKVTEEETKVMSNKCDVS